MEDVSDSNLIKYVGKVAFSESPLAGSGHATNTVITLDTFTLTSSITASDKTVTVPDTTKLRVGMAVTGTGINASGSGVNTIDSITNATTFELTDNAGGSGTTTPTLTFGGNTNVIASGDPLRLSFGTVTENDPDAILNRTWLYPYAQGGLRNGDTVWMNMTMNNPHAVEGLFAKSRGVLNEGQVWTGFNGGKGALANRPRDSIPLENFLIGDSCLETATNFVQHVNKTIELNYESMGLSSSQAPTVAYLDPYLATEGHARVLMFDVAHDREFIAFHDLHMQVQSSAATPHIGFSRHIVTADGIVDIDRYLVQQNGGAPHYFTTQIDVANGFPTENPYMRRTQQSKFIESAYVHNIAGNTSEDVMGTNAGGENPISNFLNHDSYAIPGQGKTKLALIGNSFTLGCDTDHNAPTSVFTDATVDTNHNNISPSASTFGGGNAKILKMDSTSLLRVGMGVSGTGVASGSVITQIDSGTLFRVDKITTATNNNQTITFTPNPRLFAGNHKIIRPNTATNIDKFSVGMTVSGTGIASGSKIIEIDTSASLLYLDKDTTATNSNQTLTFTTTNNSYFMGKGHGHYVHTGFMNEGTSSSFTVADSTLPRLQPAVASPYWANRLHELSRKSLGATQTLAGALKNSRRNNNPDTFTLRDASTMMDTPDGTRAISAFLCLKGIRNETLSLANHEESRLQYLDHWTKMDFVRRLTIDCGEVGIKEGVTDIQAAAKEIVRLINQGGAKNALTTGAKNSDTGSIHDPAPWWFADESFDTQDRGSHMGYLRAHLGRVVEDLDGNTGHSIIIHSTIPGASGRNFCTWLDNSKGQSQYKPQFLIGHGGRFRNFWCQPDETSGENMHPAPMPINKHGRPFAPITTLREYVVQEETDDDFVSNGDFDVRSNDLSSTIRGRNTKRSISAFNGSGMNANTINDESFESQSPSKTLVEGLRSGSQAIGRINFGGMVAAGIPGFAPDAGVWGLGERGNTDFDTRYSNAITTGGTAPTSITDYSDHVDDTQVENVGDGQLYGFQFEDHRGNNYGVRYIYRRRLDNFTNDNTKLPPTLDNEIVVYFDDRDVGQGGFTIGNHMLGFGDVTGRIDTTGVLTEASYRGNRWNGVPSPSVGIDASVTWQTNGTLTVVLHEPFDTGTVGDGVMGNHPDVLGYLGFPKENGLLQINDTFTGTTGYTDADGNAGIKGIVGHTLSYTHRTQNDNDGTHIFYGVEGNSFTSSHFVNSGTVTDTRKVNPTDGVQLRVLLSPRINWTTLVTDELMAAVTAAAINHEDPNRVLIFDCRKMYAADGRTFGQWGVAANAIQIRAHRTRRTLPLSQMFEATIHKDWGIHAAHLEYGEYTTLHETTTGWSLVATDPINKPASDADIDANQRIDAGYLPYTVLQIRSKGRGYNANTATPILVDSSNTPVPVTKWRQNLKGERYTSYSGDHILPCLNNPILLFESYTHSGNVFLTKNNKLAHAMIPAGQEADTIDTIAKEGSFGERLIFRFATDTGLGIAELESIRGGTSHTSLTNPYGNGHGSWRTHFSQNITDDFILTRFAEPNQPGLERDAICGYRSYGSVDSEPVIFFRGARDSMDHYVPLYFGGGFTGVTLDINDGTQNDYSSFYTHPYSGGPTGTAGIQNANEISGSFAMVDCNALLAFFPGTALLNQHRGSINSPVSNKNSILSPDLRGGNLDDNFTLLNAAAAGDVRARYAAGVVRQQPVPLVLRFAHPTARYHDSQPIVDATCDTNSNTTVTMDSTAQLVVGMTVTGTGIPDGATVASITNATTFVLSAAATASNTNTTLTFNYIENKTTYLVYGPGQAFPFTEDDNSNAAVEPHPGYVVTTGNTWSRVPVFSYLPNEITNSDDLYGPPNSTYQVARNRYHWRTTLNWSPPQGIPNVGYLQQRPEHGSHYGEVFTNPTTGKITSDNKADYWKAHPYKHCAISYYGIAMSADMTFHMDGGYHPGGSWLDNQMSFNAPNPNSNYRYALESWNQVNATAFRVSGVMAKTILEGANSETALNFDSDYIVVDGTRCQNGEELATIIGQAINENPGKGALKAMGGTFLPSMGNAMRQDRYGWIVNFESAEVIYSNDDDSLLNKLLDGTALSNSKVFVQATIANATQEELEQIPMSGWLRSPGGGRDHTVGDVASFEYHVGPTWGCYHSREVFNDSGTFRVRFYLAPNRISGLPVLEDRMTWHNKCQGATLTFPTPGLEVFPDDGSPPYSYGAFEGLAVWSKAGVHRFNNEYETPRNHMTQVHFGGLVDAIDRTRPVGAVGWAGERYSYLNSLKVDTSTFTSSCVLTNNDATVTMTSTASLKIGMLVSGVNIPSGAYVRSITSSTAFELSANAERSAPRTLTFTTNLYGAGKGAWHPKLGFTPYGSSASCMNVLGHLPSSYPMYNSPEASPRVNGQESVSNTSYDVAISTPYTWNIGLATNNAWYTAYDFTDVESTKDIMSAKPPHILEATDTNTSFTLDKKLHHQQGVFSRAMLVISNESELALVAKTDRDGITATGDWLSVVSKTRAGVAAATAITFAGTTRWDERFHDAERYIAPANAGPNVEALIVSGTATPTADVPSAAYVLHTALTGDQDTNLYNAEPCFAVTGDLFFDTDISPGSIQLEVATDVTRNITKELGTSTGDSDTEINRYDYTNDDFWLGDTNGYKLSQRTPAQNFSVEHVVWKRMDGGNLSLPAPNARGLGAVPFVTRVAGGNAYTTGEKLYGNNRFTFESTNSAMFPIIQAQELSHPQMASRHPDLLRNILEIPNEEIQFESITVVDDTGQEHTVEGGSPFGTIIRAFTQLSNRSAQGLAPAIAGSGVEPNMKIRLPNPDSIPGNLIVRSGFDRLQAYQTETMGTGGMMTKSTVEHMFDNSLVSPNLGPTYSDHNWEHLKQGETSPESTMSGWQSSTGNAPLETAYELHDRTLFFHVTKMGNTNTHKHPVIYSHSGGVVNHELTAVSFSGTTLTVNTSVNSAVYDSTFGNREHPITFTDSTCDTINTDATVTMSSTAKIVVGMLVTGTGIAANTFVASITNATTFELTANATATNTDTTLSFTPNGRRFLRLYNPTTDEGGVASFTGISGSTFTGCVGDETFNKLVLSSITTLKVVPSYYIPAGSTRFYGSRRIRDHAEVSGNSPDMAHTHYVNYSVTAEESMTGYSIYKKPQLTPAPIPRMGHHFVNATMAMLPGHWAHPAYQGLYDKHRACRAATMQSEEYELISLRNIHTLITSNDQFPTYDPLLVFGSLTATPSGPSDIHGGGFSLMFETKLRNDGYGVLASEGEAGVVNSKGGHTIVLEAAGTYTLKEHFPDPAEVGAYQIIIQPNMHSSQFIGYHANGPADNSATPDGSVNELTSQQVALVVGIREPDSRYGAYTLVLANATMADVRGCEVFVNELMIDHDPDHGSHFTNIPPLMLYNPLGVQATESPAFVRRSLPYQPNMFIDASPGFTTNIPWWSIVHKVGPDDADADRFNHLSWHRLDSYYEFLRASSGSIASQITLAGYPSFYPDLYSEILENISLTPVCSFVSLTSSTVIKVDDARGFPKQPYYGMVLEYTDATGTRRTHTYTERSGYDSSNMNKPMQFTIVANSDFTSNLTAGTKIRLSRAYDFRPARTIFTDTETSVSTRTISQTLAGSRDTNSLHMADAFLCLWHPNLGRPHTFYSDASRTWLNPLTDRAINQKPLNSMPEHFETVHYHDATYYASMGPFALRMKTAMPPTEAQSTFYTATSAGVSTTTVTATVNFITGWPTTSGPHTVYVNSGSEEEIFTYTGGGAGGNTLTGCVNVKGTPLTTMASGNHSLRYYKTADLAADGSHTRQVVSHTGNTITTNGGEAIGDEDYIFVDGRMYQVNGAVAEGGTSVVVFDTLPPQITVGSTIYIDSADGTPQTAQTIDTTIGTGLMQGGQSDSSDTATKSMLNHFWPCGSRGGPLVSRLDGYGYVSSTWDYPREYGFDGPIWSDADDDGSYVVDQNDGLTKSSYDGISNPTRPRPFGYRFGLRQPYNKPQWSMYGLRALRETAVTATNASVGYTHGPLVQTETQTSTYAGGSGSSTSTFPNTYTGIMERQTNFSGMLGIDKPEWQVRYSDGVRFTRPFGCPVRTLRNSSTVLRDWWGDGNGKGLDSIEDAVKYYIVDWWGNTRGEDVRRFPVRSFGIRPSWDAGDAYEYDRRNNRTPYQRIHNNGNHLVNLKGLTNAADTALSISATLPRFGGRLNNTNNNDTSTLVDVFMPSNAQRVGDMGNGRGIRYPTQFNEDILTALSEPIHTTGLVLSHHTAEPILNDGFIRARNDVLQNTEVPRGISSRLEIAENGLLKPEAVVSDRMENIVGDSPHKDAVSRSSPRIGLDTENLQGVDTNQIIINTEAHSLHTDRNVGQRVILQGGMQTGSQTIGNYDLTALDFGGQPQGGAVRMSHTSNFNPLGGTYLAETRNYLSPIDDSNWGGFTDATCNTNHTSGLSDGSSTSVRHVTMTSTAKLVVGMTVAGTGIHASATIAAINNATCFTLSHDTTATNTPTTLSFGPPTAMGSNPYVTSTFTSAGKRANAVDKTITYMMRPVRLMDKQHIEMFRSNLNLHSSAPQYGSNYFGATAGGKYGLYLYNVDNGRATGGGTYMRSTSPDTNPPYAPAYLMDISASDTVPMSKGPKIIGTADSGFDSSKIDNEVTRVIISENTLEHYRSDASRRRTSVENDETVVRKDYSVQPRFSQALHPKGHKGDVSYNSTDHSGDGA
jgi:hypothetical protein